MNETRIEKKHNVSVATSCCIRRSLSALELAVNLLSDADLFIDQGDPRQRSAAIDFDSPASRPSFIRRRSSLVTRR